MADRNISVRLRAEVGEFKKALGEGVKSLKETEAAASEAGKVVGKAQEEMARSAKRVEAAERALSKAQADASKTAGQKEAAERKLQAALTQHTKATEAAVQAEAKHKTSLAGVAKAQETAATATGRAAQRLKDHSSEYQVAGGVLAAAGAATTGLVAGVVKTGVAYNTLQQTSRAALRTMLGDSEAVNAQMAELDKFAKTSPFSKQTFITAQQQMLAFGIETKKVVPYLSAINDATAAAGGNSQQLGELAFVMAQISAAGKITGQDLIQFGQRGVNAAELIGSQMGMTGAEIKQAITDGALSADVALDALAAGMSEKFEGASANVKKTWTGATDRVSSAIRDVSALLAAPLVDPESGGAAVGWANELADALRGVEGVLLSTPAPVRVVASGLVAAGGGASVLAGGLLLALPRIVETRVALNTLAASGSRIPGVFGKVTKAAKLAGGALAVVGGAAILTGWMQSVTDIETGGDRIIEALGRTASAQEKYDAINAMFAGGGKGADWLLLADEQASSIQSIGDALERLKASESEGTMDKIFGAFNDSGDNWLGGNAAWKQTEESIKALDAAMASIVQSGDAEALAEAQGFLAAEASKVGWSLDDAAARMPLYAESLANVGAATADAGTAALQAAADQIKSAEAAEEAQKALVASYEAFVDLYGGAAAAFIDVGGAYDAVIEKNKELAQATAGGTKDAKDSWEDYYDGVTVSMKDYIAELAAQAAAQTEWKDNLVSLAGKVTDETLASLAELGPGGAALVADLVNASDKQLAKLDLATSAKSETDKFIAELLSAQGRIPELDVHTSVSGYENVYSKMQSIQDKIRAINGSQVRVAMGPGGQGGLTFASGGGVAGPGTGTSDSIPAMLSNGEHVWTASDVAKAGGQGAMYRARGLVQAGALRFAVGGAVGSSQAAAERAKAAADAARDAVKAERADVKAAQKAYDSIGSKKADAAAKKAAKSRLDAEKAQLKSAEKALSAAEKALADARSKASRLKGERSEFSTDRRRGDILDSVKSGNGLSIVDRALDLANSGDLSKKQSAALRKIAQEAERSLTTQYGLLEKQNQKIDDQKSLLSDVKGMHDSVASSIMGQIRLTELLGQKTAWGHDAPVTPGSVRAYVAGKLAKATAFAGQLEALRQRGAPDALLQEVLGGGIEGGSALASALLSAGGDDWSAITGDWRALEAVSSRIGDTATRSAFGTTAAAEQRVLDTYKQGAENIEAAILRVGQGLQTAIGKPLGFAGGGAVHGPGTGTSDSILARLSNGEAVVSAAQYAANRGLVDSIMSSSGPIAAPVVAGVGGVSTADIVAALAGIAVMVQVGLDRPTQGRIVLNGSREAGRTDAAAIRHNLGVRS